MAQKLNGIFLPDNLSYPKLDTFKLFSAMATCPVTSGLVGSYFLGGINAQPTYNFANPSLPLIQVGAPVFNEKYATLSRNAGYFDTQLKSTSQMTIFAISVVSGAGNLIQVVSNMKTVSGVKSGDSLFSTSTSTISYGQQTGGIVGSALSVSDAPDGDYKISALAVTSSPAVMSFNGGDSGNMTYSQTAMNGRVLTAENLIIGASADSSDFLRDSSVSAVLIYNRSVTDVSGQMELVMNWLRNTVAVQAGIYSS